MTTDTLDLARTLRDPAPPAAGADTRAAVHARATQIRRRRRATSALAGVSCAALLALGAVAVLDAGPTTRERVETAAAPSPMTSAGATGDDTVPAVAPTSAPGAAVDPPVTQATPDVTTGEPDVADVGATSTVQAESPAIPTTAHITVTVGEGNVPADVELDVTLTGEGGTFSAHLRTPGTISFADVPSGDYQLRWSWVSDDGTAQSAGRITVHVEPGDVTASL